MSRRRSAVKRKILPDTIYKEVVVSKFINCIMERGKKNIAQKIFYSALQEAKKKSKTKEEIDILHTALGNVKPHFEVKSRRIGGSTYRVPIEVRQERKETLAIRWLIEASKSRNGKSMIQKLSAELLDASNNRGGAVKKKEELHKTAEANKAFSHFI